MVAEVGVIALAVMVGSYVAKIRFAGWDHLKNQRLRNILGRIYTGIPFFIAYFILFKIIDHAVVEIVRSQALQ